MINKQLVIESTNFEGLLEKAEALIPNLRERISEVESLRSIPQSTIDELTEAGLLTLLTPKKYGGHELNFRQYLDIVSKIGKGCGSTAWVVTLINVAKWIVSVNFTEEVHDVVFKDNAIANVCGVFEARKCEVEKVEGGYLIKEGMWGFASGSNHSDYFFLGFPQVNENGEVEGLRAALIPRKDVNVLDDWHTISMRGTGSNSITVKNVFVPENWTTSLSNAVVGQYPAVHLQDQALYNSAFVPVAALVLLAPGLGLSAAAKEVFLEKLPNRKIQYTSHNSQAEAGITHLQLAEAVMKMETASLLAYRVADEIDKWAAAGKFMDFDGRVQARVDCAYANRLNCEAVDIIFSLAGGSAISQSNLLSIIMKDSKTPPQHGLIVPTTGLELYGRILAGQEPNTLLI
ncbi:acyl-CoA dehydrogenase family protein [Planococcus shenhongbingii]|uniref:Acyl-CoA dehydrogenase family protein n=1 Tax=Planococcus shenhongbingii TaxID=3058398 RepID=A0ABT8NGZ3_9BACL|nr:acyl-CoA dehydrogenase family protein [Planococcus sp. N017]MDN7247171.1 acyl-CoA dehydrogenase family protein [Planococcus sp. N017]